MTRQIIACTRCSHLTTPDHTCTPLPLGQLDPLPCAACGRAAWYSHGLNRYLHDNPRLDNAPCWLRIVAGDIDWDIEHRNNAYLMRPTRRWTSAA